ncbi:hypothetical protein LL912_14915 [Niabella sp. CC-SYL272]|uniref:hypothetical protein n=1 Tax=Niabella agricola TaxID=2891571 RepID=UPI001F174F62|nr:hypothetical protein [Niabella agricola]MCF3110071.1 hypothetical protein [Niabella agricola]
MRNQLYCHLLILLMNCLLSFQLVAQPTPAVPVQKLYLSPKAAGSENQTKLIDSLKFIPLEPVKGTSSDIDGYLQPTDKYFIIVNYSEKNFLLYTRNGRFIKKISFKHLGEGFWPNYQERNNQIVFWGGNKNYTLTRRDRIQIEQDRNNPRNKKYFKKYVIDLNDTTFQLKKAAPTEYEIINAYHYYDDYYIQSKVATSPLYKDSLEYELKIYKNQKLIKAYFPYNRINEPRYLFTEAYTTPLRTDSPYVCYLTRPYCDTIYKLVRDSITPVYQLVLPLENSLPPGFYTKPFKNKTERDNFNRNNGWMLRQIYLQYDAPRFSLFTISFLSNYEQYVYDKQKNLFYNTKKIKADSSQYNIQLFSNFGDSRIGKKFYKLQKVEELNAFFKQNKNVPIPKELEDVLKPENKKAPPVVIEFQFKN